MIWLGFLISDGQIFCRGGEWYGVDMGVRNIDTDYLDAYIWYAQDCPEAVRYLFDRSHDGLIVGVRQIPEKLNRSF